MATEKRTTMLRLLVVLTLVLVLLGVVVVPTAMAHVAEGSWVNNHCPFYGVSFEGYPGPPGWFEGRTTVQNWQDHLCTGVKVSLVYHTGDYWTSESNYTTIGNSITVTVSGVSLVARSIHWGRDLWNNWGSGRSLWH